LVRDTLDLRTYLLGLGRQVEVIEPASIRAFMIEQAQSLAGLYLTPENNA
jgi:predicted DNA-binding transcriptional regulator YafY